MYSLLEKKFEKFGPLQVGRTEQTEVEHSKVT